MSKKSIVIGALVAGAIAAVGATAWKFNGQFMKSETGNVTPGVARHFPPNAAINLLGRNTLPINDDWSNQGYIAAAAGFCERAKSDAAYGDSSARLIAGKDGWIFRKDELAWQAGGYDAEAYRSIGNLGRVLAAKGTVLIALVAPPRIVAGGAHLPDSGLRGADPERALQVYRAVLDNIRREGVAAPDMLAEAEFNKLALDRLYDPAGGDWTPVGARMAAHAAARVIQSDPRWQGLRYVAADFDHAGQAVSVSPYLAKIADICGSVREVPRMPTFTRRYATTLTSADVLVAGTQMIGRDEIHNFSGFLSEAVGSRAHNLASAGAPLAQALAQYVGGLNEKSHRAKFVVLGLPPTFQAISADLQILSSIAGSDCTKSEAKSVYFDWNTTKVFGEVDLATLQGDSATLAISPEKNILRNFKVLIEHFDGSVQSTAISLEEAGMSSNGIAIPVRDFRQVRSIYIQPVDLVTGRVRAKICTSSF